MLNLEPQLMYGMSDEHLIASLRAESSPLTNTPAEKVLLDRLEAAIDERDERVDPSNIESAVSEAIAQYPDEDLLDAMSERIFGLVDRLRGNNKDVALKIYEDFEILRSEIQRSADYGIEQLKGLTK